MLRAGGICAARACRLDLVLLEKRVANALVVGPAAHLGRVGEQVALDELFVHTRRAHTDEADEHEAHASRHGCGLVQQLAVQFGRHGLLSPAHHVQGRGHGAEDLLVGAPYSDAGTNNGGRLTFVPGYP